MRVTIDGDVDRIVSFSDSDLGMNCHRKRPSGYGALSGASHATSIEPYTLIGTNGLGRLRIGGISKGQGE